MHITHLVLFKFFAGATEAAAPVRIGPLISQGVFQMEKMTGSLDLGETLGVFKEPKDDGKLKP